MTAQELQLLYSRSRNLPDAKGRLWRILDRCAQSDVPGFRNLDNYRLRLLLAVGVDWNTVTWQAAPATPIRGRSPRFVA